MPQFDPEFLASLMAAFRVEAAEHLQAVTSGLLELEKAPDSNERNDLLFRIFREAHSLKGAARAVNATDIESVCHGLESVFAAWKRAGIPASPEAFDALQQAVSEVQRLLGVHAGDVVPSATGETEKCVKALRAVEANTAALPSLPQVKPVAPVQEPAAQKVAPPVAEPAPELKTEVTHRAPAGGETLRISAAKLDALLLQAEELLSVKLTTNQRALELRELAGNLDRWGKEQSESTSATLEKVGQAASPFSDRLRTSADSVHSILKAAEQDHRSAAALIDLLLEDAKKLLMLPFSTLLDGFPKLVRDLSRDQKKDVDLIQTGGEVEIDKRILEEMKDPLIHLLRNAIDHGMETPEQRVCAGKPPRGTIRVAVSRTDASKVEMVVSDDGAGIDRQQIIEAAQRRGKISVEQARALDDAGVTRLIFEPEVSTQKFISEISGRGLGMSIVKEKVEKMGGRVEVESRPGAGTSFRLLLPLTLATFRGILVQAGGQVFVIPTANVERVLRIRRDAITTVENRPVMQLQGRTISLARLASILELSHSPADGESDYISVAIVAVGDRRVAFIVDAVLHEQEVLVKSLARPLSRVRNVSGATVLGHGKPVPVLNPGDLIRSSAHYSEGPVAVAKPQAAKRHSILVAEDSITARMLLKNILEAAGFNVTTAVDGLDALTALRTGAFDLVVSDVEMPRMDGFELTSRLRADARLTRTPVILVTALSSSEHRERGVEVGANAYIVKSTFDQGNLLEAVRRLL